MTILAKGLSFYNSLFYSSSFQPPSTYPYNKFIMARYLVLLYTLLIASSCVAYLVTNKHETRLRLQEPSGLSYYLQ